MSDRVGGGNPEVGMLIHSQVNVTANDIETPSEEQGSAHRKALLKQQVQKQEVQLDGLVTQGPTGQHLKDALAGRFGKDVQQGAQAWAQSQQLQQTLTPQLRQQFLFSLQKQPQVAAKAGQVLADVSTHQQFQIAIAQPNAIDLVQQAALQNPAHAQAVVGEGLEMPALQSPQVDNKAKKTLWGMLLGSLGPIGKDGQKQAGRTLHHLGQQGVLGPAQQAAMEMAAGTHGDMQALQEVDHFVGGEPIQQLPPSAKSDGVRMLALTQADKALSSNLQQLAGSDAFRAQDPMVQARWFATIASGKPSAFRSLTDSSLALLRHEGFAAGAKDVPRLLRSMASQVQRGAEQIIPGVLLEQAEGLMPTFPQLTGLGELSGKSRQQAQIANVAKINAYLHAVDKLYKRQGEQIKQAKTPEALRQVQLEAVGELDLSNLDPEVVATVQRKMGELQGDFRQLRRDVRNRYLDLGAEPPPPMPSPRRRASGDQDFAAGSQLRGGAPLPLPGREEQVASAPLAGAGASAPLAATESQAGWVVMGRADAWGIQRTFERDLGAGTLSPVGGRAATLGGPAGTLHSSQGGLLGQLSSQVVTVQKPEQATSRSLLGLWTDVAWKQLTKAERASLSNLGWRQQAWDLRHHGPKFWPEAMATKFEDLESKGQRAVLNLGYTATSWNQQIATMTA